MASHVVGPEPRSSLRTGGRHLPQPSPSVPAGQWGRRPLGPSEIVSLQRSVGNKAVAALLAGDPHPLPVQRAWAPATTTSDTTLRTVAGTGQPKQGGTIPSGTEVVVDRAQQQTQNRTLLQDVVWTRAANVRAPAWNIGQAANVRYIRNAKLGADKAYPDTTNRLAIPRRPGLQTERRWSEQIGEYTWIEKSPRGPNTEIVRTGAGDQAFTPPATLAAIDADEDFHLDVNSLEADMRLRLGGILTNAANGIALAPNILNKPKHVNDLMKPLNFVQALGFGSGAFGNWYDWKEGVFQTITAGATVMADSIDHWRRSLYPDARRVQVTNVNMSASDLHETGLGVVFVTFRKPRGPLGSTFADQTNFEAVVKPEERGIEKSVFGMEPTSLASRLNRLGGLNDGEAIAKVKMETHHQFGSLIEFVRGAAAATFDRLQPPSPAMREAMVLAYVAGLSDVHRDNVIYIGDKPYLIDADNALNNARIGLTEKITPNVNTQTQSGFTSYSAATEADERDNIRNNPQASTSKIMRALVNAVVPVPIVDAVRKSFTGKTGRVVPVATNGWAMPLRNYYPRYSEGLPGDASDFNTTRWALCKALAGRVEMGRPGEPEPGLVGETGVSVAGGRMFDEAEEGRQIKSDYREGKIPFFNYEYDTGHVLHNGQVIWHGQSLAEALEKLLVRFPHQRGITDI